VQLLAEDHATVVFTWRFRHARPVSLSYSPQRALDGDVLIETLEIEYDWVERWLDWLVTWRVRTWR
jgi:hypothetical protein